MKKKTMLNVEGNCNKEDWIGRSITTYQIYLHFLHYKVIEKYQGKRAAQYFLAYKTQEPRCLYQKIFNTLPFYPFTCTLNFELKGSKSKREICRPNCIAFYKLQKIMYFEREKNQTPFTQKNTGYLTIFSFIMVVWMFSATSTKKSLKFSPFAQCFCER